MPNAPPWSAAAGHTAGHGWPGHATRLAAIVCRYLEIGGHYTDAVTIHTHARQAARRTGDRAAEAYALNSLGLVDGRLGRYPQAAGYLRQALALFRESGDRSGDGPGADQPRLGRVAAGPVPAGRGPATGRPWRCSGRPVTGSAKPTR